MQGVFVFYVFGIFVMGMCIFVLSGTWNFKRRSPWTSYTKCHCILEAAGIVVTSIPGPNIEFENPHTPALVKHV